MRDRCPGNYYAVDVCLRVRQILFLPCNILLWGYAMANAFPEQTSSPISSHSLLFLTTPSKAWCSVVVKEVGPFAAYDWILTQRVVQ